MAAVARNLAPQKESVPMAPCETRERLVLTPAVAPLGPRLVPRDVAMNESRNRRRTDALKQAIALEIDKHRVWLDHAGVSFRSVNINVKFIKETGLPRVVIVTTETESD